jgi:hypothetical protein
MPDVPYTVESVHVLYEIRASSASMSITCLVCGHTSHNPNDVRERYCGHCRSFLDDRILQADGLINHAIAILRPDLDVSEKMSLQIRLIALCSPRETPHALQPHWTDMLP